MALMTQPTAVSRKDSHMESLALVVMLLLTLGIVSGPAGILLARSSNKALRNIGILCGGIAIFIGGQLLVAGLGLGGQVMSLAMITLGVLAIRQALLNK